MIRIFLPLVCAALGFALGSCSQSGGPFAAADAPAATRATPHGAAAAAMPGTPLSPPAGASAPFGSAQSTPQSAAATSPVAPAGKTVERRASTLIGMAVVSADGSPLGYVKDIIFDRQGRATHLVVAYGTEPDAAPDVIPEPGKPTPGAAGRRLTAVPWDAAMASIKDGQLVLGSAALKGAPSFTPEAWPDLADPSWSAATDAYWRKAVGAAIAKHPGAPIDSTSRSRSRHSRDGN
jgi:sporulation protein YlmC with PRC-barrel domain